MKNWTVGKKLILGFSIVLAITICLGGLAIWNGVKTADSSTILAEEVAPVASATGQINTNILDAVFQIRGFMLYNDEKYVEAGKASFDAAGKGIENLATLAKDKKMDDLAKDAAEMKTSMTSYLRLMNENIELQKEWQAQGQTMFAIGPKVQGALEAYGAIQASQLRNNSGNADTGTDANDTQERLEKFSKTLQLTLHLSQLRVSAASYFSSRTEANAQKADESLVKMAAVVKELTPITRTEDGKRNMALISTSIGEYQAGLAALRKTGEQVAVNDKERTPLYVGLLKLVNAQMDGANQQVKDSSQAAVVAISLSNKVLTGGMILAAVIGAALAFIIIRSLTMSLKRIIDNLSQGSEQTSSAAGQVSSASQSLAQGASEQAAAIEETTSSVEEMASMTKQNAGNANEAKNLAAAVKSGSDKGADAMSKMSKAIDDIKKSSDSTAKIVKTIDEIAFQTNLLALNAAVEAARAGEAGKGFAVVAEEVRNLAQRSAEAAKNTANMIEESVKNADNGVQISKEVGDSLTEISQAARKVNDLVGEIAAASNEQAQGIDQINTAVGQMDQVTQQNAANAEESASASEELSAQAEELNKMVQELLAMVGGSKAVTSTSHATKKHELHFAHDAGTPAGKKPTLRAKTAPEQRMPGGVASPARQKAVNPDAVIPMDDDKELAKF